MNPVQWPQPAPEVASIVNGIVYYLEDEDD